MNPTTAPTTQPNTYNGLNSDTASLLSQLDPNSDFSKTYQSAQDLSQPSQSSPTSPTQPADTGNWFTHLLPTITSIGGGILGTLADPFTMGMGTIAGGAGGAALGKSWQNALEGKDTTMQDLGGEALSGAIGGGIGKGLGALTKGVGGMIAGQAEKGIAKEELVNGAQDALAKSQALRNVYGTIPKSLAQGVNPEQAMQGALDLAGKVGVDALNPQAVLSAAKTGVDALGNVRSNILAKVGNIPTAGAVDASGNKVAPSISDMINASLKNTHPLTGEQLGVDRTGVLGSLEPVFGGKGKLVLPNNASSAFQTEASQMLGSVMSKPNVSALDLQNAQSLVGQKAHDIADAAATATGKDAIELKAQAGAWQDLNNYLKGMFDNESVNGGVASMKGNLTAADVGGNQALADELNRRITGAQTNQDLNTSLSHFINLRNIGSDAVASGNNPASATAVRAAKQALADATGTAGDGSVIRSTTTGDILGSIPHPKTKILGAVLNAGNNGGKLGAAKQNLGTTLQRLSSVGSLSSKEGGTGALPIAAGMIPAGAAMAGSQPSDQPQSYLTGGAGGNPMQPNQPVSQSPLQQGMATALAGMSDPYHASAYAPLLQQLIGQAQQAHTANATLQSLENGFQGAGGGQGLAGGLFAKLGGALTGNQVSAYDAQRQQAVDLLSKLGIPLSAIPDVTSTAPAAQGQFQNAQNILNSLYGGQ
jgi:hypothetical protein